MKNPENSKIMKIKNPEKFKIKIQKILKMENPKNSKN